MKIRDALIHVPADRTSRAIDVPSLTERKREISSSTSDSQASYSNLLTTSDLIAACREFDSRAMHVTRTGIRKSAAFSLVSSLDDRATRMVDGRSLEERSLLVGERDRYAIAVRRWPSTGEEAASALARAREREGLSE